MANGFAFGTGSALARTAVDSMFGGHSSAPAQAPAQAPAATESLMKSESSSVHAACKLDYQAFTDCLKANSGNAGSCDYYYTSLKACQEANM